MKAIPLSKNAHFQPAREADEAARSLRKQAADVLKLLAKGERDRDEKQADRDRHLRAGSPYEKHTVEIVSALDMQLSMFPHYLRNIGEQLPPIRAQYSDACVRIRHTMDVVLEDAEQALLDHIGAAVAPFVPENLIGQAAYGIYQLTEIGGIISSLIAGKRNPPIHTDGELDGFLEWSGQALSAHRAAVAFLAETGAAEPQTAA